MKFYLLVLITVGCSLSSVQARPSIFDRIPGARFFRDLTGNALNTLNDLTGRLSRGGSELADTCREGIVCPPPDPDAGRNVSQIIKSRGFDCEEHDVITNDGYILTVQRIINPMIPAQDRSKLRPIIMQHGLMSSSVDWVINSQVVRPAQVDLRRLHKRSSSFGLDDDADEEDKDVSNPETSDVSKGVEGDENEPFYGDTQALPNSLGFFLANRGYDVWLANSRGNIYGQRHVNLSSWQPRFWSFTFDEQIAYDLPDTISYVQKVTNYTKIAYVGHSQGTTMAFGLLADRPEYADIIEPVIALAPVAYVSHSISPVKYFAAYTPFFSHINMWFGTSNVAVRYLGPIVCGPQVVRRDICANIIFLSVGFNEEELDDSRVSAYLDHMPSGTSVKNVAHYGQEVLSGRFAHFDHGLLGNQAKYGLSRAPSYDLTKIRSHSIVLFHAENDWLASPKDVAKLRRDLKVAPYEVVNMTIYKPKWNHIDYVYAKSAGQLVNPRIYSVLKKFA